MTAPRCQFAALAAWGTTITALLLPAAAHSIVPDWTWETEPGIEWAELVGPSESPTCLVATADGRLHLVDLASGKPRFGLPIVVARGVRFAGHATQGQSAQSEQTYCFDRYAAYAIAVAEPIGVAWRFGQPPAEGYEFPGDPETLSSWSHAEATPAGLLLVNTDGRVVLLSYATGRPRWEIDLGPLPVARLHIHERTAVVLWKTEGAVQAAFLNLDQDRPAPTQRTLDGTWPLWSTLLPDGLLTVSSGSAVLCPRDGERRVIALDVSDLKAQGVAVSTPALNPRLLIGVGTQVIAYDLATGHEQWRQIGGPRRRSKVLSLATHESRVIVTSEMHVSALDVPTGRKLGDYLMGWTLKFMTPWISDSHYLYVVDQQPELQRVELPWPGASAPAENVPPDRFTLQPAGGLRQVLWPGQHVVLVEPNRLSAYKLPSIAEHGEIGRL